MSEPLSQHTQQQLYDQIIVLARQFNENQKILGDQSQKLIVEKHCYWCRCSACWYDFGGKEEAQLTLHLPPLNSIYTDIHNSNTRLY